jgi:hypothetical protein
MDYNGSYQTPDSHAFPAFKRYTHNPQFTLGLIPQEYQIRPIVAKLGAK